MQILTSVFVAFVIEAYSSIKSQEDDNTKEQDLEDILRSFKIDVRVIGDEYASKQFTGRKFCEEKGIDLYFNKRDHRFSSSGLRKEVQEKERQELKQRMMEGEEKQKRELEDLKAKAKEKEEEASERLENLRHKMEKENRLLKLLAARTTCVYFDAYRCFREDINRHQASG